MLHSGSIVDDSTICVECRCLNSVVPWGTNNDINCDVSATEEEKVVARAEATELLDHYTGRQFGFRIYRMMPCSQSCGVSFPMSGRDVWTGANDNYNPWALDCSNYHSGCSSCGYNKLYVPHFDICQLNRVVVNGIEQDLSTYQIHTEPMGRPYLVSQEAWPTTQELEAGFTLITDESPLPPDGDSWWIEYTYGTAPSIGANAAVSTLAYEILLARANSDDCRLPENVTNVVRQGVSFLLDPFNNIEKGLIGIASIDRWIKSVNPNGVQSSASLVNPRGKRFERPYVGMKENY